MDERPLAGLRAGIGLTAGFLLTAPVAFAGAVGMAALGGLTGLIALPRPALWAQLLRPNLGVIAAAALLVWVTLSQLWSPAGPDQLGKIWIQTVLYSGFVLAAAHLPEARRELPRRVFLIALLVLAVGLAEEALTGGWAIATVRGVEPYNERAINALSRGASTLLILFPAAAAMALSMGGRWRYVLIALTGATLVASAGFEMSANLIGFGLAVLLFAFAWRWPRTGVLTLGGIAALWLMLFPLLVVWGEPVVAGFRDSLPFSWEWRWEGWTYARELLSQRRLTGWGVDASRTFNEVVELRGFMLSRMPLHPHSASLQLWLETGVIGAELAALALAGCAVRIASAEGLIRLQGAAAAAVAGVTVWTLAISYGLWQEWLWGAASLAAAACLLIARGSGQRE